MLDELPGGRRAEIVSTHHEDLLVATTGIDVRCVVANGHDEDLAVLEDRLGEGEASPGLGGPRRSLCDAGVDDDLDGRDDAWAHVPAHQVERFGGLHVLGDRGDRAGREFEAESAGRYAGKDHEREHEHEHGPSSHASPDARPGPFTNWATSHDAAKPHRTYPPLPK